MKPPSVSLPPKSKAKSRPRLGNFAEGASIEQLVTVRGFGKMKLRAIRADDEQRMLWFHSSLAAESIYMRYFQYLGFDQRSSHDHLVRICTNSSDSYAVVMETAGTMSHREAILAVSRLTTTPDPDVVSFDMLMTNQTKPSPLARILLKRFIKLAHVFGFKALTGELLVADHDALNLCRSLGFSIHTQPESGLVQVTFHLQRTLAAT